MKRSALRTVSVILSLLLMCALISSCDNTPDAGKDVYTVGICQFIEHEALDKATEGFRAAVTKELGDTVKIVYQNAAGEKMNAQSICSSFASDSVDLIFANSTNALAAAAEATSVIPVVGCSVTDFASTLGLSDFTGKTGFNVTGYSDILPLEKQAEVINELFPEKGKVGILYCSSEINSKYQADEITKHLISFGFTCESYTFVDTTDVTLVTEKASRECDIIYTPTDNTVASNTSAINNILEPAKIPLVAGNIDVAVGCGIATVGIDYYDLGFKAGEMAVSILKGEIRPEDTEIGYADEYFKKYVPERADALGIMIPEGYSAIE
ncbi:MAG: ABC transporter substrate-binding protein [Clostridia bacterium]|nr:ABC transporter substrate-binding protein [Clostridia bacterium]